MDFTSKVSKAAYGTRSVRTTIPEAVAAMLGVSPGAVIVWHTSPGATKATVEILREPGVPRTRQSEAR